MSSDNLRARVEQAQEIDGSVPSYVADALLDAVDEIEAERDTLRRLCLEAADMLDEPTAIGDDAMDAMAARLRAAGGER